MSIPRDITYCTNEDCTRDCERNMKDKDFRGHIISMSNFHEIQGFTEDTCENYMVSYDKPLVYTDIWNGFQFRPPTYLDGHFEPDVYSLVKWVKTEPHEVIDGRTGQKVISKKHCYVVGELVVTKDGLKFNSCGLRYLEDYVDGLNEWILSFARKIEKEKGIYD